VRISVGAPRWPLGYGLVWPCKLLMPRRDMLKLQREEYRLEYVRILAGHGADLIAANLEQLAQIAGGKPLVLLCFEDLRKRGSWCHRRMFADWWHVQTGQDVPELARLVQPNLFDAQAEGLLGPSV
jgi:hypothetical protein